MTITVDMTTASAMIKVTDVFVTMSTILIIDIRAANMITVTFMFKKTGLLMINIIALNRHDYSNGLDFYSNYSYSNIHDKSNIHGHSNRYDQNNGHAVT